MLVMEGDWQIAGQTCIILISLSFLAFYVTKYRQKECGWEVMFVATVEPLGYLIAMIMGTNDRVKLASGRYVPWVRYASWLVTCPVLLIHIANLDGKHKNNKYMMELLTTNQIMIIMGVSACVYQGSGLEWYLYAAAAMIALYLFKSVYNIFALAMDQFPDFCYRLLANMLPLFLCSWSLFPILFALGPEGFGVIDRKYSIIGHCIADLFSKNIFGYLGWCLRWKYLKEWEEDLKMFGDESAQSIPLEQLQQLKADKEKGTISSRQLRRRLRRGSVQYKGGEKISLDQLAALTSSSTESINSNKSATSVGSTQKGDRNAKKQRVLLVERDLSVIVMLRQMLEKDGLYEVDICFHVADASSMCLLNSYAGLLLRMENDDEFVIGLGQFAETFSTSSTARIGYCLPPEKIDASTLIMMEKYKFSGSIDNIFDSDDVLVSVKNVANPVSGNSRESTPAYTPRSLARSHSNANLTGTEAAMISPAMLSPNLSGRGSGQENSAQANRYFQYLIQQKLADLEEGGRPRDRDGMTV